MRFWGGGGGAGRRRWFKWSGPYQSEFDVRLLRDMRRNHWAEKGNTGPQLSLSLTILRSVCFELSDLLKFDTRRTTTMSSRALLKGGEITFKKPDTTTWKWEIWCVWKRGVLPFFHCLTWRFTQSHLDDDYQQGFRFSFSCSSSRKILFTRCSI